MERKEGEKMAEDVKLLTLEELDSAFGDVEVEIDKEADAFAAPAPPDDGMYIAKAKLRDGEVKEGTTKDGTKFAMMNVQYEILEGPFERRIVFDSITSLSFGGGANKMYALAEAMGLGGQLGARGKVADLIKVVFQGLQEERTVKIETQWQASEKVEGADGEKATYKVRRRGQKSFPQNSTGGYKHTFELENGVQLTAQARVIGLASATD
jgi:hypothetical protein